jgi:hypothetical protein
MCFAGMAVQLQRYLIAPMPRILVLQQFHANRVQTGTFARRQHFARRVKHRGMSEKIVGFGITGEGPD